MSLNSVRGAGTLRNVKNADTPRSSTSRGTSGWQSRASIVDANTTPPRPSWK
jgi:hypothetical protein